MPEFSLWLYVGQQISTSLLNTFIDLHNETGMVSLQSCVLYVDAPTPVNIHTHLYACVLFVFFLLTFNTSYMKSYEDVSWADRAVFAAFLSSAAFCLFCSAFFHMSSCHSKDVCASQLPCIYPEPALITALKVATRCNALDYSGIIGKPSRSLLAALVVTVP